MALPLIRPYIPPTVSTMELSLTLDSIAGDIPQSITDLYIYRYWFQPSRFTIDS
eukprot:gene1368-1571_t